MDQFLAFPVVVSHGNMGHFVGVYDGRWSETRRHLKFKPERLFIVFTVPSPYGRDLTCAVNSSHIQGIEDLQQLRRCFARQLSSDIINWNVTKRSKTAKRLKLGFDNQLKFLNCEWKTHEKEPSSKEVQVFIMGNPYVNVGTDTVKTLLERYSTLITKNVSEKAVAEPRAYAELFIDSKGFVGSYGDMHLDWEDNFFVSGDFLRPADWELTPFAFQPLIPPLTKSL